MTSDDSQPSAAKQTVGEKLKEARQKQGLSVAQIAEKQHLRSCIISDLEKGDYSQVDNELFIKGYVRTYATQVGLDADAIVSELDQELEPLRIEKEREIEANPLVDIERKKRKKRRIAKIVVAIIVALVVAATVVTVAIPKLTSGSPDAESPAAASETVSQAEDRNTSELESSSDVEGTAAQETSVYQGEPDTHSAETPDVTPEAPETDVGGADEQALLDEPEAAVETVQDPAPDIAQTAEPILAEAPMTDNQSPASGVLEITFNDSCWVQVLDKSGNRLESSLQTGGDTLRVSGAAPLQVVIGAVDAVDTIQFQGEPVEIEDYPVRNNRSEFTLTI
ncbi:RodZ domain-containing protein [Marinobacter piscensis]|uniref:RodZ domain-containing protein n=1 Tax=Marinobacter piscensis TaxID=1562308 RepID=UPI0011A69E25|nr:RodZ domain-containing protein [Marinobacter piscensis]